MMGIAKNAINFLEENNEVLEDGANPWHLDAQGSTCKKRDFSR